MRPDRRAPDPRADAIRRAAERSCRAAERSCRRRAAPAAARSLRADCNLSYLLTGVFSAPASGVFERRADPRPDPRIYGYYYYYYILNIFLYFNYLDYYFEIPVNEFYEFYVKRQVISRILPEVHQDRLHSLQDLLHSHQDPLRLHHGFANYLFGNDSGGFGPHGGLELLDRRRLDELFSQGGLLQRFVSAIGRHGDRQRRPGASDGRASHHRVLG